MKYSDARPLIKTGDLLLFSHVGWGSWYALKITIVRIYQRSKFSHVGIAGVANGRVFVMESVGQGVRPFPLSRTMPFYWIPNPVAFSDAAIEWMFDQIGKKYESKTMMVWSVILKLFGRDLHLERNDRPQCSEFFNGALQANGQFLTDIAEPAAIGDAAMAE